jgi:phosphohistidine phosphatase
VDELVTSTRSQRKLTLIRHAHASVSGGVGGDHERELDALGQDEAIEMAQRWCRRRDVPNALLSSTALRAQQTARVLAKAIGFSEAAIEVRRDLYGAGVERLLAAIEEADPAHAHLAIVCHNPGISTFVRWLCAEVHLGMPTCGVARIELDVQSWFGLEPRCGRLVDFDHPGRDA